MGNYQIQNIIDEVPLNNKLLRIVVLIKEHNDIIEKSGNSNFDKSDVNRLKELRILLNALLM